MPLLGRRRDHRRALQEANELAASGRALEAVELLTEENRSRHSPELEARLVELRNLGYAELGDPGSDYAEPASEAPGADDTSDGLPAISAAELTAPIARAAFLSHGGLIVRGLVEPGRCKEIRDGIDRVFEGREANAAGAPVEDTAPWYKPFEPEDDYAGSVSFGRGFVGKGSGIWTADSPRLLFELLETFTAGGLGATIGEYLGERPAISVNKGTLRRAAPEVGTEWWHRTAPSSGRASARSTSGSR